MFIRSPNRIPEKLPPWNPTGKWVRKENKEKHDHAKKP